MPYSDTRHLGTPPDVPEFLPASSVVSEPAGKPMPHVHPGGNWWGHVGNSEERFWNMGAEWRDI